MHARRPNCARPPLRPWSGAACVLLAVLAGCAGGPRTHPRKDLLAFQADGHSTCADVLINLGDPSQQYENGRLLTYRIARDAQASEAVIVERTWERANYSLIVRCNDRGEIEAHALVA